MVVGAGVRKFWKMRNLRAGSGHLSARGERTRVGSRKLFSHELTRIYTKFLDGITGLERRFTGLKERGAG